MTRYEWNPIRSLRDALRDRKRSAPTTVTNDLAMMLINHYGSIVNRPGAFAQ